jgi:maltose O-acetyltransferase
MSLFRKVIARFRGKPYFCRSDFEHIGTGTNVSFDGYFEKAENISIGEYCYVGPQAYWSGLGGIKIGNNVIFGPRTCLYTQNHNWCSNTTLPFGPAQEDMNYPIIINDNVWVCLGVHILPGVTIGEGAILSMGAVVTKDVPPLALVGGNPATVIKLRNTTLYNNLKEQNAWILRVKE